jgi:hypothetical protein
VTQLCVWCVPDCRGHRVPRAPLPRAGVTRAGAASKAAWRGLPPRRRSYGLMRQTIPLSAPRLAPCARGLCRLSPVPAARWPFPTLSPRSVRRCSGPYPAALLGCACPLSSPRTPVSPHVRRVRRANLPPRGNFGGEPNFEAAVIRLPSGSYACSPPGCSHRGSSNAAGRPGLSHHVSPGRLPGPGRGVATCSTRTISMAGLSPAGSRPCRPLPNALGSCLGCGRRIAARARDAGFAVEVAIGQRGAPSASRSSRCAGCDAEATGASAG